MEQNYLVHVDAELEEGMNCSKDLVADEIIDELTGNPLQDAPEATITTVTYNGSKKGKPMDFTVTLDIDDDAEKSEDIEAALEAEFENITVYPDGPNDQQSTYAVSNADAEEE